MLNDSEQLQDSQATSYLATSSQSTVLLSEPFQPKDYNFPKTKFGNKLCSFQSTWFVDFSFLHYDQVKDCVYCLPCRNRFLTSEFKNVKHVEAAFHDKRFSNWKKARESFSGHLKSECADKL